MKYLQFTFLLLWVTSLSMAQSSCIANFQIETQITGSTCQANGTIDVALMGDLTNIDVAKTEYALKSVSGKGTNIPFTTNSKLENVSAGDYIVSVRTFCKVNDDVGVVKESNSITVPGNYNSLMAEFDIPRSRNSHTECVTGIIAFNVKDGTGAGNIKVSITKAPQSSLLGIVSPTLGSTVSGYIQYTLPGFYPAGDYELSLEDNCSIATIKFTVKPITFVNPYFGNFLRLDEFGSSQTRYQYSNGGYSINTDLYRHFTDGMYEIAIVPTGKILDENDWNVYVNKIEGDFPDSYNNYYAASSLSLYFRIKGCASFVSQPILTQLKTPTLGYITSGSSSCDQALLVISKYKSGSEKDTDFWCYPLTYTWTNTSTNAVIGKTISLPFSSQENLADYGTYDFKLVDDKGTTFTSSVSNAGIPYVYTSVTEIKCSTFKVNVGTLYYNCFPAKIEIADKVTGTLQYAQVVNDSSTNNNVELPYGSYVVKITSQNGKTSTKDLVQLKSATATTLSLSSSTFAEYKNSYFGRLFVAWDKPTPAGTTITVVNTPEGCPVKGKVYTLTTSRSNYTISESSSLSTFGNFYMPKGNYTVNIKDPCGINLTTTAYLITGFDADNVRYSVYDNGCVGNVIKLASGSGYVREREVPKPTSTYFKIISGPIGGYDTAMQKFDGSININADGQYIVGTSIQSGISEYIRRDTINFVKSKPGFNPSVTSAYVCADPAATKGTIIIEGTGGSVPYIYNLLNEDSTDTGIVKTGSANQRIVFANTGEKNKDYIVKMTDNCGNSTSQKIHVNDLQTQRILYSTPSSGEYCIGDSIKINCITLGQTTYKWEKKNAAGTYDFVSNSQNPTIPSANESHSGVYRITVTPEYCGTPIQQELSIKVFPKLKLENSSDQTICINRNGTSMSFSITGGKGTLSYQWQVSIDNLSWGDIPNAKAANYTPIHNIAGKYYYRLKVSDDCTTEISPVNEVIVKHCGIIVNPNIQTGIVK